MKKRFCSQKILIGVYLGMAIFLQTPSAFAHPGPDAGHSWGHPPSHWGPENVSYGRYRYNYHDGRFFWPLFFGLFEVAVSAPPVGVVVTVLPSGYETVVASGIAYYHYNNIYYKDCSGGYVVVEQPVIVQPVVVVSETATVNVPDSHGGYTLVVLTKTKGGYIGPQGEYYRGNPTVGQLKVLYGK